MNLVRICMHYKACRTKRKAALLKSLYFCLYTRKAELPGTVLRPEVLL